MEDQGPKLAATCYEALPRLVIPHSASRKLQHKDKHLHKRSDSQPEGRSSQTKRGELSRKAHAHKPTNLRPGYPAQKQASTSSDPPRSAVTPGSASTSETHNSDLVKSPGPSEASPSQSSPSESPSIMDRGRPRKRVDSRSNGRRRGTRSASLQETEAERKAFEELPQGCKPAEAASSMKPQDISSVHRQAYEQALRFEVLNPDSVETLSRVWATRSTPFAPRFPLQD